MRIPTLKLKAVLFDLDGTLLDTAPDLMNSCNRTLERFGFAPVAEEVLRGRVTAGMREMLKLGVRKDLWESAGVETVMRDFFARHYVEHICERTVPFEGIPELLSDLVKSGIKFAVVTNKYEDMAVRLLRHFDFHEDISAILGCDSLTHYKPHPEPVLKALSLLDAKPYEAVYVGDHLNDIMAANSARTPSAAALWGYGTKECVDVSAWHARYVLRDVSDLRALVLGESAPKQISA